MTDSKSKSRGGFYEFPIRVIAGSRYHEVPDEYFAELFAGLGERQARPGAIHLIPARDADDYLEFPAERQLEDEGFWVRSGIARHIAMDRPLPTGWYDLAEKPGMTAKDISGLVPGDIDWYGACIQVLQAHGWADIASQPTDLAMRIFAAAEPDEFSDIEERTRYGDNWSLRVFEVCARDATPPLSRLWYAANMLALYYIHHDDYRLGYLYSEYRLRLAYEAPALRALATAEKNRENGKKGGQAEKKAERYSVLDHIVNERSGELTFLSDREVIARLRQWASEWDAAAPSDDRLFEQGQRSLSSEWYSEYLSNLRQRKAIAAQQTGG